MFGALYAYLQSFDSQHYKSFIEITLDKKYSPGDINVLFDYMPSKEIKSLEKYDLVFISNGPEPLAVATETMIELVKLDNVYILSNSYVIESHPLYHKIIWSPVNIQMCKNYWTNYFYPQYYENIKNKNLIRHSTLVAINGALRTNRYYFFNLLQSQVPAIRQYSNIGKTIQKLNHAHWESIHDKQFREYLNNQYTESKSVPDTYYDRSPVIGIDGEFGKVQPGYFIMPEYFTNSCVIFPESGWQNDELSITEKALKCFYAGSLPFPIGGAGINQLYNNIGFYTAWNLLPDKLKLFDQIKDHSIRYQMCIDAISWLQNNQSVFQTNKFLEITTKNKFNFLTCNSDYVAIDRLFKLIKTKLPIDLN